VKPKNYFIGIGSPDCDRENYIVEADTRWAGISGASYGLLFGITPNFENFYSFEVNTDFQEFVLYRYTGAWTMIAPITYSPAIYAGTAINHLKIIRNGSAITLEVNGISLGTWVDNSITGKTGSGLIVSSYSDVPSADALMDNFKVMRFEAPVVSTSIELESVIEQLFLPAFEAIGIQKLEKFFQKFTRQGVLR
jgi:hypothetical protein